MKMLVKPFLRITQILWVLILVLLLTGCFDSIAVPEDRKEYVGHWQGEKVDLLILPRGQVKYNSSRNNVNTRLDLPLKSFDGNNFTVGVSLMKHTFKVQKPPKKVGEKWLMTVDGVELTRVSSPDMPRPNNSIHNDVAI